jgi:hypothetical protein
LTSIVRHPIFDRALRERSKRPEYPRIVDQQVDRADRLLDIRKCIADGAGTGHIGGERACLSAGSLDQRHRLG